jgi:thymidylate kinase
MDIPPIGDTQLSWPKQVVKPTFMFLLTLPEKERIERLSRRASIEGIAETFEESNIRIQSDIANKINLVYKRLGALEILISASDSVDDVVMKIVEYIDDFVNKKNK